MSQNYNKGAEGHNYYAPSNQQTNIPQNMQPMNRNPQPGAYGSIPVSVAAHDIRPAGAANFAMYRTSVPQMQQGFHNHAATAAMLINPMQQTQRPNFVGTPVQQAYFIPQYPAPPSYGMRAPSQVYRGAAAPQPQQPTFVYPQMQQNLFFQPTAAIHQRPTLQPSAAPNGLNNIPTEPIPIAPVISAPPPPPQTPTQTPPQVIPVEKRPSKALAIIDPVSKKNVMEGWKMPEKGATNSIDDKLPIPIRPPTDPYILNHQGPTQMGLPPPFPPMGFDGKHYGNLPIWTPPPQQQTPVVSANIDGPSVIPKQQPKKHIKPAHSVPSVTEESASQIIEEQQHEEISELEEVIQEETPSNGEETVSVNASNEEIIEIVKEPEAIIEIVEQIEDLKVYTLTEPVEAVVSNSNSDSNVIKEEDEEDEDDVIIEVEDKIKSVEEAAQHVSQPKLDDETLSKTVDETDKSVPVIHPAASRPEQVRNDFERVMEKYGGQLASNAVLPPGLQKDANSNNGSINSQASNKEGDSFELVGQEEESDGDKENNKPSLKNVIEYHEEQWSPTNPNGKKYYTIEQLLELGKLVAVQQNKTPVKINPTIQNALIPNHQYRVETILQRFNQHRHYQVKRLSQQGNRQMHMNQKMQAMANQQNQSANTIKISLSLREEVKLKEAANAWKPKHLQNDVNLSDDERVLRVLTDSFRCVLNKLTPDNFDILLEEVKGFEITKFDQLNECILLVFEKAISEPNYSVTYSLMCKELAGICVQGDSGNQKQQFKNCLINQCQIEFEKAHRIKSAKDRSDLLDKETDPVKREELREKLEEEDYKMRKRAVGTVRFIGELYKIDLLTIRIMHTCVNLLLETRTMNEESLECLCKLLTTVGKKMETDKKDCLAPYFTRLQEIIGKKSNIKISSRIKFMIQDVIDLRNNRWQPRRNDQNPKTMGQIQKEVEIEQRNIQMMHQYHPGGMGGQMGGGPQGRNRYDKRMGGQQMNYKPDKMTFDSAKMDFSRLGNMEAEANLGRATFYQHWNTQGTNRYQSMDDSNDVPHRQMPPPGFHHQSSHQHNMGPQSLPMMHPFGNSNKNRDNYRSRGSTERRDYNHHDRYNTSSGNMHSRENSMTKSGSLSRNIGPPGIPMMGQQQQQQQPQQQNSSSATSSRLSYQSSSSGRGSVDSHSGNLYTNSSSHNSSTRSNEKQIQCEDVSDQERERLKKFFKGIFEDFMGSRELEYAISDFLTIERSHRWVALTEYATVLLEEHEKERQLLAQLCIEYIKKGSGTLTIGELLKIFSTLCEIGLDSEVDIPKVGDYIAEYLAPIIKEGILRIQDLIGIGDSWIKNKKGHELLLAVLQQFNKNYEFDVTRDLWCQSGLTWEQFIPHKNSEQLTDFIQSNTLLLALDKAVNSNNNGKQQHNWDFIEKSILECCHREKDEHNIKFYIEEWLSKCNTNLDDPNFIRAFTAATIQYCIVKEKNACYVNEELFTIPKKLLKLYANKKPVREMHALYAIQRVACNLSYPQNLLHSIFMSLYEQRIISVKGFIDWYNGEDMSYQKGVAKTALRQFMVNISEEQSEHSSSEEEH